MLVRWQLVILFARREQLIALLTIPMASRDVYFTVYMLDTVRRCKIHINARSHVCWSGKWSIRVTTRWSTPTSGLTRHHNPGVLLSSMLDLGSVFSGHAGLTTTATVGCEVHGCLPRIGLNVNIVSSVINIHLWILPGVINLFITRFRRRALSSV